MRNLKRALSLTLASVMLLGMMVVGSSAAAGYSDVDENDNVEAIEVLQAVEVMVGDDRGFGPDRPVTRNEMAVVMGKLLNLDYNYYASTCPFNDVADWARGWVGACAANGIVSGRGNGIYDGESTVTAIEAASMMMRALGYFKNIEDYADGFQVVTVRQGSQIGIFDQVGTDANTPMTRNQVAQMALNALESNMVDFTGTPGIEVNGVKVGYKAEYTFRSDTDRKYAALSDQGDTTGIVGAAAQGRYYIQLGEELYNGKLTKQDDIDAFGRPARTWEYDTQDIGTYVKKELLVKTYIKEVEGGDIFKDIGSLACKYPMSYWIDGIVKNNADTAAEQAKLYRNSEDTMGNTDNGVTTEVYVDSTANGGQGSLDIVEINTYLAFATADYNKSNEYLPIQVWSYNEGNKVRDTDASYSPRLKLEDFAEIESYKEDDALLVQIADGKVKNILEPTYMEDTKVTRFSQSSGDDTPGKTGSLTTGGTKYDYNVSAQWDGTLEAYDKDRLVDATYDIYIDQNNFVVGAQVHSAELKYVFVTAIDYVNSNLANATGKASAIFPDGTMQAITIDVAKSNEKIDAADTGNTDTGIYTNINSTSTRETAQAENWNTWYSYTMKGDNYVLTPVANQDHQWSTSDDFEINSASNKLLNAATSTVKAFGNEKSVYITVDTTKFTDDSKTKDVIKEPTSVGTGIKNVDLVVPKKADHATQNAEARGVYYIWNDKEYVIAAIVVGEDNNLNKDFVYMVKDGANAEGNLTNASGDNYWEFSAIKDGKYTEELLEVGDWSDLVNHGKTVMRVWYNKDGAVTKAETAATEGASTYYETDFDDIDRGDTQVVEIGSLDKDTAAHNLVQRGDTLYIGQANATLGKNGLVVADDCSIVVIVNGDVDDSIGSLSGALAAVDYDKGKTTAQTIEFEGNIAALLNEKGEAKVLIFDCITEADTPVVPPVSGNYSSVVDKTITAGLTALNLKTPANNQVTGGKLKLHIYGNGDEVKQIREGLAAQGYEITEIEKTTNTAAKTEYTIKLVKDGVKETVTCCTKSGTASEVDVTKYWIVDVDSTKQWVEDGHALAAAVAATGKKGTGTIVSVNGGTSYAYNEAYGANTTTFSSDAIIRSGYVNVSTPDVDAFATNATVSYAAGETGNITVAKNSTSGYAKAETGKVIVTVALGGTGVKTNAATGNTLVLGASSTVAVTGTNTGTGAAPTTSDKTVTFEDATGKTYIGLTITYTISVANADISATDTGLTGANIVAAP